MRGVCPSQAALGLRQEQLPQNGRLRSQHLLVQWQPYALNAGEAVCQPLKGGVGQVEEVRAGAVQDGKVRQRRGVVVGRGGGDDDGVVRSLAPVNRSR